jgi:hypothetical protein
MKDVDRIRIRKVYACCPGWHSGGHKSAHVSHEHMLSDPSFSSPLINEDLLAGPQLVFTLNNRFFRHQACYSLLPAKPGGQADRVISLCKYKVLVWASATKEGKTFGFGLVFFAAHCFANNRRDSYHRGFLPQKVTEQVLLLHQLKEAGLGGQGIAVLRVLGTVYLWIWGNSLLCVHQSLLEGPQKSPSGKRM